MASQSSNPVHWHSAFWGLVTIALNTALQPVDNVCDTLPAKYHLSTRSSPVFCFVDTILLVAHVIDHWRRVPLRQAMRLVAKHRGLHDEANLGEEAGAFVSLAL